MGIFDKLFSGGKQTTEQKLPDYVTTPAKQASSKATAYASRPYEAYTGDLVAGLTPDQLSAYDMVRSFAGSTDTGATFDDAASRISEGGSAPAGSVSTTTLLDPIQGVTGEFSLQDYENPYIDNVVAKTLEALDRDRQIADLGISAQATAGGGFGSDRHGVAQSENFRNSQDIKGQTAARLYADAFNTAAGLKNQDTARALDVGKTNASLNEQMLSRLMSSGSGLAGLNRDEIDQVLKIAAGLESAGAAQQGQKQNEINADYSQFLEGRDWDKQMAEFLASISSGLPAPTTVETKTKSNPLASLASLAGSIAAAA